MSIDLRATVAEPDEIPDDRLFRLSEDQFRRMVAAGVFGEGGPVALVDGLVRDGGPDGPPYRFRLDQYHRIDGDGILSRSDRVEFLGGRLVAKVRMNPPHRIATHETRVALERLLPPGWYADEQKPVSMPLSDSEPEPDLQITRGSSRDYAERHPEPGDVALLVEVSDATISIDRGYQKRLYASEGIPAYWIVNIPKRRVEVYTGPSGPAGRPDYARRRDYVAGESIPVVLDGREVGVVAVDDILP